MENKSPISIALVDDHTKLRAAVATYLENLNYKIILQAANGIAMLKALAQQADIPRICILDINMPEMNGVETAKQLSIHFPEITILAFSGNSDMHSVLNMIKAGARGYLLKGCEAIEIRWAVEHLLAGKYYFSEPVKNIAIKYLTNP